MSKPEDLRAIAAAIIDANLYMTLGTADAAGQPWVSPVYYAAHDYREFFWTSTPDATHSRNLTVRPRLSIVIFDSQVPAYTGQAVYMTGTAEELSGAELDRAVRIYPGGPERGAGGVTVDEVSPPALYRLYRATVTEHWVLDPDGHPTLGRAVDHRAAVTL